MLNAENHPQSAGKPAEDQKILPRGNLHISGKKVPDTGSRGSLRKSAHATVRTIVNKSHPGVHFPFSFYIFNEFPLLNTSQ